MLKMSLHSHSLTSLCLLINSVAVATGICSRSITLADVDVSNCTILPDVYSWLPCRQLTFPGYGCGCGRDLFPDLYDTQGRFPGEPTARSLNATQVQWKTPQDSAVMFLAGFEIRLAGQDSANLGNRCVILDLNNADLESANMYFNLTFSVSFPLDVGVFKAYVTSLPEKPSPIKQPSKPIVAATPVRQPVCFPNSTIDISVDNLNQTHLSISFTLTPDSPDLDRFWVSVYNSDTNDKLLSHSDNLRSVNSHRGQRNRTLDLLPLGNYSVEVYPYDPNDDDPGRCLCYYTLPGSPFKHCESLCCTSAVDWEQLPVTVVPSTTPDVWTLDDSSQFKMIGAPILGAVAGVALLAVVWVATCRRRMLQGPCLKPRPYNEQERESTSGTLTSSSSEEKPFSVKDTEDLGSIRKLRVYIVSAADNVKHTDAVETLGRFLTTSCCCDILTASWSDTETDEPRKGAELTTARKLEWIRHAIDRADVIIVVQSEAAYRYFAAWSAGKTYTTDAADIFLPSLDYAIASGQIDILSLRFTYTQESFTLNVTMRGVKGVTLPSDLNLLKQFVLKKQNDLRTQLTPLQGCPTAENELRNNIEAALRYQERHSDWFLRLHGIPVAVRNQLRPLDSLGMPGNFTNKDCPPQYQLETKIISKASSIPDKTADSINMCERDIHKLDSCSGVISFIRPEEELEGETTDSLLYRTMEDINNRYDYIITHLQEDDCVTVGPVISA